MVVANSMSIHQILITKNYSFKISISNKNVLFSNNLTIEGS